MLQSVAMPRRALLPKPCPPRADSTPRYPFRGYVRTGLPDGALANARRSAGPPLRLGLALPLLLALPGLGMAAPPAPTTFSPHPGPAARTAPADRWTPAPAPPTSPSGSAPAPPRWAPLPNPAPPPSATPPATSTPSAPPAAASQPPQEVPLYRLTGYELRQEMLSDADWRRLLGPRRYRQEQAGRWLKILGGATAFAGAVSLLVGLGNLANQTNWGRQPAESHQPDFEAFVIGFGCMTGVGGAALLSGVMLSWSLPERVRPMYLPQLQRETQPGPVPTTPARSAPLSSFPTWAWAAPASQAWIQ